MNTAIEEGKSAAVKFYNSWEKYVKKTVPADRLLVFEVKHGWEPLCQFLDLSIPEDPFPHVNDTATIKWNLKQLKSMICFTMYCIPTLIAIATAVIWIL